ncbi:MAG TPA: M48 family metalloprotease [Methylomirabilota bacterium]|nr:M48 family metalloprotease [Methylomirabilota bacterium]
MDDLLSSAVSSSNLYTTVQGPVDRTSFFDEQRRNRRATWRLAVACGLAIVIVGVPLSLVLAPLLYAIALVAINSINLFFPIPGIVEALQRVGNLAFSIFDYLAGDAGTTLSGPVWILAILAWFVPGIAVVTIIWLGIYFLFRHGGVGAIALSTGARLPRVDDLEEQQLKNLVEEMAIAAGVSSPRVMLLDGLAINAAAVGSSVEDATIIVSRRLLDECDRDQTQAIIGHLIASVGNGDLRIAFLMTSVLLTFGCLVAILKTSFGPQGRVAFVRLLRLGVRASRRRLDGEAEKELLQSLISDGLEIKDVDDKQVRPLMIPFVLASLSVQWTLFVLIPGLLNPCLALLWRTRRYLADATAVQLTRNPDAVARALLGVRWGIIPGSEGVAPLFITGAVGSESLGDVLTWQGIGFHPPMKRRLNRLRAVGAHVDPSRLQGSSPWSGLSERFPVLSYALRGILAVLLMVAAVACLAAIALFALLSLFMMGLFIMAIHLVFMGVGAIKGWLLG